MPSGSFEEENLTLEQVPEIANLQIDALPDVIEYEEEGSDSLPVLDITDYSGVSINKEDAFLDENGQIIDPASLSVFDRLKLAAKRIGQSVNDPDKNCKKCYGRGYTGINRDGNIPLPCDCIYKKFYKENPNWRNQQMPSWNRKAKRSYDKKMSKYITLQAASMRKKYEDEEKSKANLGKNTPNFLENKAAREAALAEAHRLEALKAEQEVVTEESEILA